jgi:hypothetical protein
MIRLDVAAKIAKAETPGRNRLLGCGFSDRRCFADVAMTRLTPDVLIVGAGGGHVRRDHCGARRRLLILLDSGSLSAAAAPPMAQMTVAAALGAQSGFGLLLPETVKRS